MHDAETVLGVLRDRGRRGLPLNELYRQVFNASANPSGYTILETYLNTIVDPRSAATR